jgi:hypothetical protein
VARWETLATEVPAQSTIGASVRSSGSLIRLAVELDGRPYHVAVQDMERDRLNDAALQRLGHVPIRFTDFRFEHDRPGILRDLHHFLGVSSEFRGEAA